MEIFNHDSNIPFLGMRKYSIAIALALMIASIALIATKGLNYGLDFTGGVSMVVDYDQSVQIADVRDALAKGGLDHAVVQTLGGTREVSIRMQPKDDPGAVQTDGKVNLDRIAADVTRMLQASRPDAKLKSRDYVGSEVGAELRSDGTVAAVFVILGIMAYLWIRFERRFAIAAVATEIHDVLVTLGILALVQREFDMTVLASVLAVIGYSINDKVVVFDRIRELFRLARKAEPEEILNRSINNTLSRTIITSLFTAITMGALYFFGGPAVHGFAVTMLIGILVGTLSSIFVASPILLWLGVSKKDLMPVTKENPELARRP
ncbi:protein translocase subunit SecF [Dyella sp. S184]|uniref:protein translocase subunit SecF n=1 Tax=Dyella sp. S184 TaxID=1641862 RepID=UPI00131C2A40|nr:protein translocase subunit SecF [Dyella sp. S184]